jgi:excisionase family DNA binding protein
MLYGWNLPEDYEADILGDEETLSMAEVASELYLTRERVRQLIRDGYLRAHRHGATWCVAPQAVRDYRLRRFRQSATCPLPRR